MLQEIQIGEDSIVWHHRFEKPEEGSVVLVYAPQYKRYLGYCIRKVNHYTCTYLDGMEKWAYWQDVIGIID